MRVKDILFHLKKFPKKGEAVLAGLQAKVAKPKAKKVVEE
jgi:hypothetical protein